MALTRELGSTGIRVTRLCAGAAAWSPPDHPHGGSDPAESAALERATHRPRDPCRVRHPPWLRPADQGRPRPGDRRLLGLPDARVLAESLDRLGLTSLPLVFLHDPENTTWERAMADDGPVAALVAARGEGLIGDLGLSGGPVSLLTRFLETGHFEAVITHNRYTLVDRGADPLLDLAAAQGLGVLNAAPYGGGILTRWPVARSRYAYGEAPPPLIAAADEMGRLCADAGVPLAAAALQFSTRDPRITSTIVGMRTVADLEASIALDEIEIPEELWDVLLAVPLAPPTWQDAEGSTRSAWPHRWRSARPAVGGT